MFKAIRPKSLTAVTAAVLVAGFVAWVSSTVPEAQARDYVSASLTKTDPVMTGAACSSHAWPNYDAACQFDHRRHPHEVPTLVRRVIALR
jgi:hypothetical protein